MQCDYNNTIVKLNVQYDYDNNCGEPKQVPHIHDIHEFCLSVYLSIGPYVHNTITYKCSANLQSTFNS